MMRKRAVIFLLLAMTACSKRQESPASEAGSDRSLQTFDVQEAPPASSPGVSVTAAPGVAFNYRYTFRLPNLKIGAVQERHAQMCEQLGVARCRITGMRYRLSQNADVSASLDLKLDPAIARGFGKSATQAVTEAEGMLIDQEITGDDVGTGIAAARRSEAAIRADIDRIDRQLAQPGLSSSARAQLIEQQAQLRQELRTSQESRGAAEEALARTPMHFDYGSGAIVPGFDARGPIRHAFEQAGRSLIAGIAVMIVLVGALLPWALLCLLAFALLRWLAPKWRKRSPRRPEE